MDTSVKPGDVLFGKYRVERVLGKGGMGLVVAARHLELGELFAIKFLLPSMVAEAEVIERFVREARAAARLRSDHVARVHDVGRMDSGAPYMVMEYLDGSDLKALVRKQGPLPVEDAVMFVLQACDAIAEAHAAGIVHRDLKPANLFLIRRPNGSPSVKVLDFGISKQTGGDAVELTTTGVVLGSPMYMSPEQIASSRSADARSDIWAMGVVLYELVTGRGPFKASTVLEVIALVLQADPARPVELRPDLPPAVEAVMLQCLRKRPEERFQSIGELAAALRGALHTAAGQAMSGGAFSLPARPSAASVPDLLPAAAPFATAPALSSATSAPSTTFHGPATTLQGPAMTVHEATSQAWGRTGNAPAPRQSSKAGVAIGAMVGLAVLLGGGLWFVLGGSSGGAATPASDAPAIAVSMAPIKAAAPASPPSETPGAVPATAPAEVPAPASTPSVSAAGSASSPPAAPSTKVPAPPTPNKRPTLW